MDRPELSVIVLCYRAEEGVLRVLEPLCRALEEADITHELVLVANYFPDTGDRTPQVVEEFARERPGIHAIARPKQGGMGWDMRSGLELARGNYLVAMDGDAQNPPGDALRAYLALKETGAAVVKGRRRTRLDGVHRQALSWAYNVLFRLLFGTRGLWDINGKPKGFTRAAYEQLELSSDDWFIDAEIVLTARRTGLDIVEIPVVFNANEVRASFVRPSAIMEFLRHMARERFRGGK